MATQNNPPPPPPQPQLKLENVPTKGEDILKFIKLKPYEQILGGQQYTYSIFAKKRQRFAGSNVRFLCLKGLESISYSKQFPNKQVLPFQKVEDIPKPKVSRQISDIEKVENNQLNLIITFLGQNKQKWQFECPSKNCCIYWKKKIQTAHKILVQFKESKFEKFEDFIRFKKINDEKKQNEVNNLLNTNNGIHNQGFNNQPVNTWTNFNNGSGNINGPSLQGNLNNDSSNFNANININTQSPSFNGNINTPNISGSSNINGNIKRPSNSKLDSPTWGSANLNTNNQSPSLNINKSNQNGSFSPNFNSNNQGPSLNANLNGPSFSVNNNSNQNLSLNANLNGPSFSGSTNINSSINNNQSSLNNNLNGPSLNGNMNSQGPSLNANIGSFNGNMNSQGPSFNANVNSQGPSLNGNMNSQGLSINSNINNSNDPYFTTPSKSNSNNLNINTQNSSFSGNFNTPNLSGSPNINSNIQSSNSNSPLINNSLNNNQQPSFNANLNGPSFSQNTNLQNNIDTRNLPISHTYKGPKIAKFEGFIYSDDRNYLSGSLSGLSQAAKQNLLKDISRHRRNWMQQLIGGQQQTELVIDFKQYVQKIAEIIINELYLPQQYKIYPSSQYSKEHISYVIEDIYVQIYFYNQQNHGQKHKKYKQSSIQFKNLNHILSSTKNQGILKVPLMMMFQYKGFLGMAKSRIGKNPNNIPRNKELYSIINLKEFQQLTKINPQTLLNENKCKIVQYDRQINSLRTTSNQPQLNRVFFIERLLDFLPLQQQNQIYKFNILRTQLIQDEKFDNEIFRSKNKKMNSNKIKESIDDRINFIINIIENEDYYFSNSRQLAQLLHSNGLNMRHLGKIYKKAKHSWLRKIIQSQIIARCFKQYFRYDIQDCVVNSFDKIANKDKQQERQRNRVINFLNILLGNSEATFKMWRNINNYSIQAFDIKIWENQFTHVNVNYLLQAIQANFHILLSDKIHQRKFFKNMNAFAPSDFIRFTFKSSIYDLNFTNVFDQIQQCIQERTNESFHDLCQILTTQTSTGIPFFELIKNHPIHEKINIFLINFTSPDDSSQLYKTQGRFDVSNLPSRFLYQSKFGEMKWSLKYKRYQNIQRIASFIQDNGKKWLGQVHPLFAQVYRLLAEYFCQLKEYYSKALKYAHSSLSMQQNIFGQQNYHLWKDYFLIAKTHFINGKYEDAMNFLTKARVLAKVESQNDIEGYAELYLLLSKIYFNSKYYKQSYAAAKQVYKAIKEGKDEKSLNFIVESVTLIKQLLEINQQHQSYYKFVQSDFSNIMYSFVQFPNLLYNSIKMTTIPYLKNVILQRSKNKLTLLNIIEEISKIPHIPNSCLAYIKAKISQGTFPKSYLHCLKDIDSVIQQIISYKMMDRWLSFNRMSNKSLLDKIGNSKINRGFQFLANMTALFNYLGQQVLEELFIMQK